MCITNLNFTVIDEIFKLLFVIIGGLIGFLSSIGVIKYRDRYKKIRLKRMIKVNLNQILSKMQTNEKEKIRKWIKSIENPNVSFMATSYYRNPALIEELKGDLFLFNDPIPVKILEISGFLKFYRDLHEILVQRCTDITRGCTSFDECVLKLKDPQYKVTFLKPAILQIDENRKRIIEEINSIINEL